MTAPLTVTLEAARRLVLHRQGLWPATRWRGRAGTLAAVEHLGAVQMDPLTIVARSHDLVLWSRVAGYRPAHLGHWLYKERVLFDYGGVLRIQPMAELPLWRLHMERRKDDPKYSLPLRKEHPELFGSVRKVIRRDGPLPAKAIARAIDDGNAPQRTTTAGTAGSYRSGSVIGRVAYQMWMSGELMTHHREGFERHYDLAERIATPAHLRAADEAAVREHFSPLLFERNGLITEARWRSSLAYILHRPVSRAEATSWLAGLRTSHDIITVKIDGQRGTCLATADAASDLETLAGGGIPKVWRIRSRAGATPAVRILSPLDPVVAGERAKTLFGFEHIWEIYKPADKRVYGPYTMPLLYGDALVGRLDPRMDRATGVLHINGVWLENPALAKDTTFTTALNEAIGSLAAFAGADSVEVHACHSAFLRKALPE